MRSADIRPRAAAHFPVLVSADEDVETTQIWQSKGRVGQLRKRAGAATTPARVEVRSGSRAQVGSWSRSGETDNTREAVPAAVAAPPATPEWPVLPAWAGGGGDDNHGTSSPDEDSGMDVVIRTADQAARRGRRRLTAAIAAGVLVLGGITAGLVRMRSAAPKVASSGLWIDTVQQGRFSREVRGSGVLVSTKVELAVAQSEATIIKIAVQPGTVVKPGDLLVQLSSPEVERQSVEAELSLKAAQADLLDLTSKLASATLNQEAAFITADAEYKRALAVHTANDVLKAKGHVANLVVLDSRSRLGELRSRRNIEQRRLLMARSSQKNQLAAQESRVAQMTAMQDSRSTLREGLQVKAQSAGIVQTTAWQVGQRVAAGTVLLKILDPRELHAEIRVAENQATDIRIGQKSTVEVNDAKVAGQVTRIDPAADNGAVRVTLSLPKIPTGLRPEQTINGTVLIEEADNVVFVGRATFAERGVTIGLFKLDSDSSAMRVPVQIGRVSVNTMEITSGLQPGDRVVLSDMSAWDAAQSVRLH